MSLTEKMNRFPLTKKQAYEQLDRIYAETKKAIDDGWIVSVSTNHFASHNPPYHDHTIMIEEIKK